MDSLVLVVARGRADVFESLSDEPRAPLGPSLDPQRPS
jgi:hypothetical protein